MDQSLKGAGKLSRKILTILVLSAMTTLGYAADNTIYIDQTGDYADIKINQDGAGNQVRGLSAVQSNDATAYSLIKGNGVKVDINQVGSNNKMNLGIDASTGATSVDFKYSTVNLGNISGSNNTATFQIGTGGTKASDTVVDVTQLNGSNIATVSMVGADNQLNAIQSGGSGTLISSVNASGTRQLINTSGGTGNSVTTNLTGNNGNVDIKVAGATNIIDITQSGNVGGSVAGSGHQAIMDITGSGNTVVLAQSGSTDANVFNLKVTSASAGGNQYRITQNATRN